MRTQPPAKKNGAAEGGHSTVHEIHIVDQLELRPSSGAPMIFAISRTLSARRGWEAMNIGKCGIRWNLWEVEIQPVERVRDKTSLGK
jgi:hypothetical protein